MSGINFIPRADLNFNIWVNNFGFYLIIHAGRMEIPFVEVEALKSLLTLWNEQFATTTTPETATRSATVSKNGTRKKLEAKVRSINNEYLRYNRHVTDSDRENMSLPIYKTTHTPVPVPTTYPEFTVDSSLIRYLKIHFRNSKNFAKAKPRGVHGAEIAWAILESRPITQRELSHSLFKTHSPFMLQFDEWERGKSVYFCIRWENTKGEKGPWSEIMKTIIP